MEHRPSRMELKGMWPYWKERNEAVKNDLVLDRTILLTGPNMAGKSTVLRSIAAVALLGACGLAVPGEREGERGREDAPITDISPSL